MMSPDSFSRKRFPATACIEFDGIRKDNDAGLFALTSGTETIGWSGEFRNDSILRGSIVAAISVTPNGRPEINIALRRELANGAG